jgi:hypothetical protein
MVAGSVDPGRILAAAAVLAPLRDRCEAGAAELLGQFAVVGERRVQAAVDRLVDDAADLLLAVSGEAGELALALRASASRAAAAERGLTMDVDRSLDPHQRRGEGP